MEGHKPLTHEYIGKEIDEAIDLLARGKLRPIISAGSRGLNAELYRAIYNEEEGDVDHYYYAVMELHPTPPVNIAEYIRGLLRKKRMKDFFKIVLKRILMDSIWCLEESFTEDEVNEELLKDIIFNAVSVYTISKEIMSDELRRIFKFVLDAFVFEYGALVYHGN